MVPRIVASSIFTVDPTMFEHMPYHVSDWVQFGETSVLQTFWSAPFMEQQDVTHYERHPFLTERMAILDPWDIGLQFPKYAWAYRSSFQRLNCLLFPDWYRLYLEQGSAPIKTGAPLGSYRTRKKRKQVARALSRMMDKAGPLLVRPSVKRVVNRLLNFL